MGHRAAGHGGDGVGDLRDALGQTPMQYLTDWRMSLARDHLRTGELTLTAVSHAVGYGSPCAFAAAFTRQHGEPPGSLRRRESGAANDPHPHGR
ncbi:helix-turn-helix transcriptional regulator [Streptomyces sp. NBC_01478]|uniref:helix-turn-helix transcriptional regulator n=1 Tax=Streptomyces sp. NBC_01478 TaxID=2903882 RepID=UPI002E33BE6C|nr:helix-turn-helix transcriptional regulator [Streptomyces sp. NBC_01478]